jgi:hypothetical protein
MLAIRAVYDGQTFSPLPNEPVPDVAGEVPVAIVFLNAEDDQRQRQIEVARRMRAARNAMPPLDVGIKELIEAGRER